MIKALFICGRGRARSPTAAQVFADWPGVQTDFGGVSRDADDALSSEQIEWATQIYVMENRQAKSLADKFAHVLRGKRVITLAIRDDYSFMDDRLVDVLKDRVGPHLRQGKR